MCTTNVIFGPSHDSTSNYLKQWPQVWMQRCFGTSEIFLIPGSESSNFFVTFYNPNSCGNSIVLLNMSLSTFHSGNNESSLIKFGVHLDLQK
jgi:hypothetical protein